MYATGADVQARIDRILTKKEMERCEVLLEDAAVMIDAASKAAGAKQKKMVACRMVVRALGTGDGQDIPIGATQGSMSALGYQQSWTLGSGSAGELYLSKADKKLLGMGNRIGAYSPLQGLAGEDA